MQQQFEVVVAGAGPVGLLTAIELALGGVQVLVLERFAKPSTAIKAKSIRPLATEALKRRGMTPAIAAEEARSYAKIQNFVKQNGPDDRGRGSKLMGHCAGLPIARLTQDEPERRSHAVDQQGLEAMLNERAHAFGIEVRRQCGITRFIQDNDGVQVEYTSPDGVRSVRCGWLVGSDGGRSSIRKMAGFEFPGTQPTCTLYQVIADFDHPERLRPNGWNRTSNGGFSYGPTPGRLVMIDFKGPPEDRAEPVTREEIETVLRRISDKDVRVQKLESGSRWADNTRLVDTYRLGKVLLAGDAAHIHPPFGGQGLNLGLVDAANLGWKLARVVRGEMPESLLDTYTAERRPVAKAVLANTLAQIALLRPDPQSGALRDLFADLTHLDDVTQFMSNVISGLFTRYDLGSERAEVGRLSGNQAVIYGGDQVWLYDLMKDGKGVFLDASFEGRASRMVEASAAGIHCAAIDRGPSLLLRPDACIAWAGEQNSLDGLKNALGRWFRR